MSKSRVIANRLSSICPTDNSLTGLPRVGSPNGAQCGRKFIDIVIVGHILRLEMDFGDTAVIAGGQAIENFRQPQTRLPIDPPHDAEINRSNAAIGGDEQIALMHVGVEEAL